MTTNSVSSTGTVVYVPENYQGSSDPPIPRQPTPSWHDRVSPWLQDLSMTRPTVRDLPPPREQPPQDWAVPQVHYSISTKLSDVGEKPTKSGIYTDQRMMENANKVAENLFMNYGGRPLDKEDVKVIKAGIYSRAKGEKAKRQEGEMILNAYKQLVKDKKYGVYTHVGQQKEEDRVVRAKLKKLNAASSSNPD